MVLSFIKALELNKEFYIDVVKLLLEKKYPDFLLQITDGEYMRLYLE